MNASETVWMESAEVLALARAGVDLAEWSPLGGQNVLLMRHSGDFTAGDEAVLADWLRGLACPVLGIINTGCDDPVSQTVDVRLEDEGKAELLVENINANPVAATTFIQLLRITENMPLFDALQAESLAFATLQGGAEYTAWLAEHRSSEPYQPTDEGPAVVVEREGENISLILNRPSNRNAMSVEMRDALNESLGAVLADESIRQLRISGRGRCFSIGGDLTEFGTVPDPAVGHIIRSLTVPGRNMARCTARLGDQSVVHVHGACIGSGIEFPAFAGHITAAPNAHFQLPEVGMGLIPGAGGCISIARRMGRQRTAWLGLSGKRITAKQALGWGLVDELVA